ncbi:hypothetical protein CHGG_10703 [Chaetomium globosum CBS 148.51]|uniref:Endonuclease/exonuclease/phosphatase domain-containing protein n=1 Tax=Chaetomium globosum (strain ATCC 6205 / CBS 148.51 / DSM 1962 / NBRC 6347 / NRRL 1970) TaxID=306901 RepID=Q2GMV1_CHAGB|nr:uncharacterized protein CHGG_10703 [Chaetomium globosum CBS 148.51]EAQ84299.1 hypothetical protein CHGG_10703 [Chaetomium globosum CBS 148.51]
MAADAHPPSGPRWPTNSPSAETTEPRVETERESSRSHAIARGRGYHVEESGERDHAGGYDARSTRVWDFIWSQQPDRDGEVRYTDAPGGDQRTTRRNVPNDYLSSETRLANYARTQLSEELRQARDQIDTLQRHPVAMASSQPSARGSYAEVARTPPSSQPSGVRTLSSRNTTPSSFTDTLFCTIDTSRVEEKEKGNVQVADIRKAIETEARAQESMGDWRCAAVVKEARNPDRVRVICRDEGEVQLVKEAAVKISVPGVRVLRDQLYPVRVDNANRTAVLDADGNILRGAAEALGTENDVNIAKIAWLSRKDTSKAYGSMVVYVTKGSEARRLLDGRYFHLAGESAYTTVFAPREGPIQCYRCQEIGHKGLRLQKAAKMRKVCGTGSLTHKTCQFRGPETLKILQLNVRKRREVQQSLLNDEGLKDFAVLAISEPYARLIEGSVTTVPMSHHNWTKLIPTTRRETTWPIRSMLWVRSDIEVEQIPVPSADLTAARIRLPDRAVLMVSVRFRNGTGTRTDIILAGDFNRHDQLWGGDDVSPRRQGEGDRIINLMDEHSLCSLLPRGTKTWQSGDIESTIDLVLASAELADQLLRCTIHPCDHGSDHRAIETAFDTTVEDRPSETRFLFKNAPWAEIRTRVAANLERIPWDGNVQQQTDRLMAAVTEAVYGLTPKAKPSPYAKRWWTTDLTRLRQTYTFWRNQARSRRRIGQTAPELEQRARMAAKEYYDAIRRQKSSHWNDFLADDANIWQATKYLQTGSGTMGDKIPPLVRPDGSITEGKAEQAQELLTAFFPPLPARIEDEGQRPQRAPVHMPDLTMEEIEQKVLSAKPWKAPGEDGLPAMVWRQLWPVVKDRVLHLFRTSLRDGDIPSQWRNAKIIPLKKPGKSEYTLAKSWRPISLLSTLARQLFVATVAPVMDYAANVWMHACGEKALSWLNRAQKIGALAITGAFRTAATAVVEAEASIYPVRERHAQAAASLWINIHTLPGTHPLAMKKVRNTVRFVSPLQKIARVAEGVRVDRMETIQEYAVPPWAPRLRPTLEADRGKAAEMVNKISGIVIATSSSVKKGIVGMGGLARDILFNRTSETVTNYAVVLGTREEQNPYTAELAAIAMALEKLPASICHRHITVITRNQSALAAVGQPRQQSGQSIIRQIYDLARLHRQRGNSVNFLWIPAEIDFALGSDAKAAAQRASKQGRTPDSQIPQAKSTAMRLAMERQRATRVLPVSVGKFSKAMDAALPGKHTRHLYDKLKRREACVLAEQLTEPEWRRLNGFLSRIGAVESDLCACGQARESVEHFLFRCVRWTALREDMLQCTVARRGSLSFYLGGKAPSDIRNWSPDMKAVRATIKYAMATGRLELNEEESLDQSQ